MPLINGLKFDSLRGDVFGGITAAVVALPLALAFGVASGAGAIAGLYGAVFVGFFAALFGGTPAQVSGPTGPMTVVMAAVFTEFAGEPAAAFAVVMLGGALQIVFGAFRLGRFIELVPVSVLSGFMTGIGCIIIILQLGPLLGYPAASSTMGALAGIPDAVAGLVEDAALLGALSLIIVFFTPKPVGRIVPPPLLALIVGSILAIFYLSDASVIGEIPTGIPEPVMPTFDLGKIASIVRSALILALLGSIDSLLTSLIHDNVTQTYHKPNRELIGQGIGNLVAGFFGGIPGAGATMRTMVNVRSGGRTPISGALHAIILAALVLGLGPLAEHIPHAVLAGILIKVGIDIIDWGFLKRLHKVPRAAAIKMVLVLGLTVFVDLILAVGVGIVLASLLYVKYMADHQLAELKLLREAGSEGVPDMTDAESEVLNAAAGQILLLQPSGPMSFGAATGLGRRVFEGADFRALVIDLSAVPMIDSSAAVALEDIIRRSKATGRGVYLSGIGGEVEKIMGRMGSLEPLAEGGLHRDRLSALQRAAAFVMEQRRIA